MPKLSVGDFTRGMLRPMSLRHAVDPFAVKAYPKHYPLRLAWTAQSRLLEFVAERRHRSIVDLIRSSSDIQHVLEERGLPLTDTAVTTRQLELLKLGLTYAANVAGDAVEVGSYRGVTTVALAAHTKKTVFAVDPFIGYGGSAEDYALFQGRTDAVPTIKHIRKPSGEAAHSFRDGSLSFVFIDAIHDVSNSFYDFAAWSPKVGQSGLIAMHDVDDHPGVGLSLRRILKQGNVKLWSYCPNLAVLKKC
jgi:predicted O-methyltransferase YrrM